MKIKNKKLLILLVLFFFLILTPNSFAYSSTFEFEDCVSSEREKILENFSLPDTITEDSKYLLVFNTSNTYMDLYYTNDENVIGFKIHPFRATMASYDPVDSSLNCLMCFSDTKNMNHQYVYFNEDYTEFTFSEVVNNIANPVIYYNSSGVNTSIGNSFFVDSNINVYMDDNTLGFQHPGQGGLSFPGIVQEMKMEIVIQTILGILPKIAIVVVSLIALLISSQLLWKQLKRS